MSFGNRRDHGSRPPDDRQTRPHQVWPSPNVEDLVVIEDVPLDANFVPLHPGTPRHEFSNLKLVFEKEMQGTGAIQFVRRTWATKRLGQEAYNLARKYAGASATHPLYIRQYRILRSEYAPLTAGTALTAIVGLAITNGGTGYTNSTYDLTFTGGSGSGAAGKVQTRGGVIVGILLTNGGTGYTSAPTVGLSAGPGSGAAITASIQSQSALLIDQEDKPADGDEASIFVDVTRVWMTLPGPVLTSWPIDGETQSPVKVETQLVSFASLGGNPPSQVSGTGMSCTAELTGVPSDGDNLRLYTQSGNQFVFEFDPMTTGIASSGGLLTWVLPAEDGSYLTVTTDLGVSYIFEFDPTGNGVTFGRTAVSGTTIADQITALAAALTATQQFSAAAASATTMSIARTVVGDDNQTVTATMSTSSAQVETATAAGTITDGGTVQVIVTAAGMTGSPITLNVSVDGTKQVETATVSGSVDVAGAGNYDVIVTAAGMAGSPKTIPVAVANSDSASDIGGKVRAELALDADVTAMFAVSGSTTNVVLTATVSRADDPTLNIELFAATSTATGPANVPTSANTTAGVAGDTASTWAGKVRTALNGNANITALFTVGGAGASITLTRTVAALHDSTLNISLANGTTSGVTAAPTSANTANGKPFTVTSSYSGGQDVTSVTTSPPANTQVLGVTIAGTALDNAINLEQSIGGTGYFSVSRVGAVLTITRLGAGSNNVAVFKTGATITKTNFTGGSATVSSVEYKAISTVHGQLVTSTLHNYGSISRTEYDDVMYPFPRLITDIQFAAPQLPEGQVRVQMNWSGRSSRSRRVNATITITYGPQLSLPPDTVFSPVLADLMYNGIFLNVREQNVLNDYIYKTFNTASDNPIYGYVAETFGFPASNPSASGYLSMVGAVKTVGCKIRPWKYGLYRKEITKITLE